MWSQETILKVGWKVVYKTISIRCNVSSFFNPLNPKIKICIPICCTYSFPTEVVRRS